MGYGISQPEEEKYKWPQTVVLQFLETESSDEEEDEHTIQQDVIFCNQEANL